MAMLFFEGFDRFGSMTNVTEEGNWSHYNCSISGTSPRTGRACLSVGSFGGSALRLMQGMSGSVRIYGCGVYLTGTTDGTLIGMYASAAGSFGLTVRIQGVNQVTVNGPAGILWQSPTGEPLNTWLYFELKADCQGTATGSWTLRRNGQLMQAQSGVQTLNSGAHVINSWMWQGAGGAGQPSYRYDDVYACDGSGSSLNDFLGPVRARYLLSTANDTAQFTPSTGSNFQNIDDVTSDDDSTYNSSDSVSLPKTDLFTGESLPAEASLVRAVKATMRARKEDAATVQVATVIKSGSTEAVGTTRAIDTGYGEYYDIFTVDPATGSAFTPSAVNSLKRGYRRIS